MDLDYTGPEYDSYWCINVQPFQCNGCGKYICYVQAGPHLIIIWPNKDDDTLLEIAALFKKDERYDPRIVRYNRIIGPCVTYEDADKYGWLGHIRH